MKLKDFLAKYEFKFSTEDNGREIIAKTEIFVKRNGKLIGRIRNTFDIIETNDLISTTQSSPFLFQWSWASMIEESKRMQLDYFAIQIPIEDFFPRSEEENLSNIYNSSVRREFNSSEFNSQNIIRITSTNSEIDFRKQGVYVELYRGNEQDPFKEFDSRLELGKTSQIHNTIIEIPVEPGNITAVVYPLDEVSLKNVLFSAH